MSCSGEDRTQQTCAELDEPGYTRDILIGGSPLRHKLGSWMKARSSLLWISLSLDVVGLVLAALLATQWLHHVCDNKNCAGTAAYVIVCAAAELNTVVCHSSRIHNFHRCGQMDVRPYGSPADNSIHNFSVCCKLVCFI